MSCCRPCESRPFAPLGASVRERNYCTASGTGDTPVPHDPGVSCENRRIAGKQVRIWRTQRNIKTCGCGLNEAASSRKHDVTNSLMHGVNGHRLEKGTTGNEDPADVPPAMVFSGGLARSTTTRRRRRDRPGSETARHRDH